MAEQMIYGARWSQLLMCSFVSIANLDLSSFAGVLQLTAYSIIDQHADDAFLELKNVFRIDVGQWIVCFN